MDGPELVDRCAVNGYGVYGMCENVHEWCSDWYAADYYAASPNRNPRGPISFAALAAAAASRLVTMTRSPREASCRATSRPMPRLDPVISASTDISSSA